jgi:hypothetical protein
MRVNEDRVDHMSDASFPASDPLSLPSQSDRQAMTIRDRFVMAFPFCS